MIRDSKAFSAVLTTIQTKTKDENVVQNFTLRHEEEGEKQIFLNSYADKAEEQNIRGLFYCPVQWKKIEIESNVKFKVEFDEVEFEAVLKSVNVRKVFKKGSEFYIYDLKFQKETDRDIDPVFQTYLNHKEINESGRKTFIQYSVYLTILEKLLKS